jgi:hypothetical protein
MARWHEGYDRNFVLHGIDFVSCGGACYIDTDVCLKPSLALPYELD